MKRLALLLFVSFISLTGCGFVTVTGSTPRLTPAVAKAVVAHYYDQCYEAEHIGQCAIIDPTLPFCAGLNCKMVVAAPFRRWYYVHREVNDTAGSLGSPQRQELYLTAAGAQRCYGMGAGSPMLADATASGCQLDYAPVNVTVTKIMQHDDVATVVSRVHFNADPAIVAYIQTYGAAATAGTPLDFLARAQGRSSTLRLTYDANARQWGVGSPNDGAIGGFFMFFGTIALVIVAALMGLLHRGGGGSEAAVPAGAAPSISFAGKVED